jgi:SSS family solute:Na+ symporter
LNAAALISFSFIPTLLGMAGRVAIPGITDANLVLPTVLLQLLPAWLGALALAAVFSTEVDTCDAVLFMLSTTLSQDVYRRHWNPRASDETLLRVARTAAILGGGLGVLLSIYLGTVTQALLLFYAILVCTLFVPIIAGLFTTSGGAPEALAAILAGVSTLFLLGFALEAPPRWLDPTLGGIAASGVAFLAVLLLRRALTQK